MSKKVVFAAYDDASIECGKVLDDDLSVIVPGKAQDEKP